MLTFRAPGRKSQHGGPYRADAAAAWRERRGLPSLDDAVLRREAQPAFRSDRLFTATSPVGNRTRTPLANHDGVDPLELDLHLPPGRGSLPWGRIAGALRDHDAALLLEVEPSHRSALPELMAGVLRALAAPPAERPAA
jgi:hypothetical protein